MMSVAIAAMCSAMTVSQSSYRIACEKAFEAGTVQTGIWEAAEKRADQIKKVAETTAKKHVSEEAALVITAGYTVLVAQEARVSTRHIPYVQSTVLVLRKDRANLTLSWSF